MSHRSTEISLLTYLFVYCMHHGMCVYKCSSEDNLEDLVLSYHMNPRDQTQVIRIGSEHLYLLSRLTDPS